jgi:hypothetical protein
MPAEQDTSDADDDFDDEDFDFLDENPDQSRQAIATSAAEPDPGEGSAQPNRLDVLNNMKSAAMLRLEDSGEFTENMHTQAETDSDMPSEPAHALSVLGRSAAADDDYWFFESWNEDESGAEIALQTTAQAEGTQALGDWITQGAPSEVLDYQRTEDSLMLVWDDLETDAQEPDVAVESDPFDEDVKHVLMNGKSVAEVYGDPNLTVADLTVIPLSSALIVGLEPEPEPEAA